MSQELLNACRNGDLNQIKTLLTNKYNLVDIHYKDSFGDTALICACANGRLNIIKYLLTSTDLTIHANIHDKNSHGENPLMYACNNGHLEIVKYLLTSKDLKAHAKIHDKDRNNNTLIWSCYNKKWDIAQYLIIEQNFQVDEDIKNWLIENKHQNVLNMIQSRDLYQKMNNNLSDSDRKVIQRKI